MRSDIPDAVVVFQIIGVLSNVLRKWEVACEMGCLIRRAHDVHFAFGTGTIQSRIAYAGVVELVWKSLKVPKVWYDLSDGRWGAPRWAHDLPEHGVVDVGRRYCGPRRECLQEWR